MSGVKLSGPFSSVRISALCSTGKRSSAMAMLASTWSQLLSSRPKEKSRGRSAGATGIALRVEEADEQAADILAAIEALVIGKEERHVAGDDVDRLGQDVEMLDGMQRNLDADHGAQHAATRVRRR